MRSSRKSRGSGAFSSWAVVLGTMALCLIPFYAVAGVESPAQSSSVSISGSVTYYSDSLPVDNVKLFLSGGASDIALSDAEGYYQFTGLETGLDYTVTPERGKDDSPITALDASLILRYLVGATELDGLQLISGDVSDNGEPTAFDAGIIMRYVVNNGELPHHLI